MLTNRISPCLDVKDGRVVKGVKFVELADKGDPAEQVHERHDASDFETKTQDKLAK